jgi:rare lipoprotein A
MSKLARPLGLIMVAAALALGGCSNKKTAWLGSSNSAKFNSKGESLAGFAGTGSPYLKGTGPIPKGGGRYHVGKPYQVAGRWFHPKEDSNYDKQGAASWYGEAFHRRKTSNGEYFDMNMLSAAHPTLPLPSYAKVTNLENGKTIVVRINDRGPFVGTRIIDLSKRSSDALGFRGQGKANVRVQWIGNAPLNDKGSHLAMMNKSLQKGASVRQLASVAKGRDLQIADAPRKVKRQSLTFANQDTELLNIQGPRIIVVGTFSQAANAQAAYDQVASLGPAQLIERNGSNGTVYRVQLGPFRSSLGAEDVLQQLRADGFPEAVLAKPKLDLADAEF